MMIRPNRGAHSTCGPQHPADWTTATLTCRSDVRRQQRQPTQCFGTHATLLGSSINEQHCAVVVHQLGNKRQQKSASSQLASGSRRTAVTTVRDAPMPRPHASRFMITSLRRLHNAFPTACRLVAGSACGKLAGGRKKRTEDSTAVGAMLRAPCGTILRSPVRDARLAWRCSLAAVLNEVGRHCSG